MKLMISLVLGLFLATSAYPQSAQPSVKGQADASYQLPKPYLQFPNKSVTNLGGLASFVENGNTNLLSNASYEHGTAGQDWTTTGATLLAETSLVVDGKKSLKLTTTGIALSHKQTSTINAAGFALGGVQGAGYFKIRTSVQGLYVCPVKASVSISSNYASSCYTVKGNNTWEDAFIPYVLGGTDNGVELLSSAALTASQTIYVDQAFAGPQRLRAESDQSRIVGVSYFAGTASCNWSRTSTTVGAFTATAACPGPTIEGTTTMGSWQTTDSDLPRQTINNLPAGKYKAKFIAEGITGTSVASAWSISDGTTSCYPTSGTTDAVAGTPVIAECVFEYSSAGNRSFELYTATSSSSVTINNARTAPASGTKFILQYFGSGSTYSSNNADTDWAACGHTTSDFTGFGTVTNIETQCKRQGSDLLMKGKFTSGASTAVEGRVSLKFGGATLTSKGTSVIPSLQIVGNGAYSANGGFYYTSLIEPSVSYLTFGLGFTSTPSLAKATGSTLAGSGASLSFDARIPIDTWDNSNIIIGQFNGLESCASTASCTDIFSAKISSTGVVTDENMDWINGNCSAATSTYTCTLQTTLKDGTSPLVNPLTCTFTDTVNNPITINLTSAHSATQMVYATVQANTNAASAQAVHVICQKAGSDYVGKTAKAVASDQNLAVPGFTKAKICYYAFGGASSTLTSPNVCTTGTCTEMVDTCGTGTPPSFSSTGIYANLTFASGTWAPNSFLKCECEANAVAGSSYGCARYFPSGGQTVSTTSTGGAVFNIFAYVSQPIAAGNVWAGLSCTSVAP